MDSTAAGELCNGYFFVSCSFLFFLRNHVMSLVMYRKL